MTTPDDQQPGPAWPFALAEQSLKRAEPADASDDGKVTRAGNHRAPPDGATETQRPLRVLVTGLSGRLGQVWLRQVSRAFELVGLDRRAFPGAPTDLEFYRIDLRSTRVIEVFERGNFDAVVHLGTLHNLRAKDALHFSWNVTAFHRLLECVERFKVPRLVVLSSADVYGPGPANPAYIKEDAPLLGAQRFFAIRDLVSLDLAAQNFMWRVQSTETVILRPCHVVGTVRNAASTYFNLMRPLMLSGFDPMIQLIHERDLLAAIEVTLGGVSPTGQPREGLRCGVYNVAGQGALPLSQTHDRLGLRPRSVPLTLARTFVANAWGLRASRFPAEQLDHIRYPCTVDNRRFVEATGFAPRFDFDDMAHSLQVEAAFTR